MVGFLFRTTIQGEVMYNVTYTQTSFIRSCPRKYYFRYVQCLVPKVKDTVLLRGTVIHDGFEMYFHGAKIDQILKYIVNTYDNAISKATPEQYEDLVIGKFMVFGMFKFYPFQDIGFTEVYPEEKFKITIGNMRGVRLLGKVDGRVMKDRKWWIREVKTTSFSFRQAEDRARVSYQGAGYMYGEQKMLGIPIQGILFDFIRKSALRKRESENVDQFGHRIVRDYAEHMLDPKTARPLNESRMYKRFYSYRSPKQLSEYESDLKKAVKLIRDCRRKDEWMRNPDVCYFYGKECPYMKICWMMHLDQSMLDAYYEKVVENPEL